MGDERSQRHIKNVRLGYGIAGLVMIPIVSVAAAVTAIYTRSPWSALPFVVPWILVSQLIRWGLFTVSTRAERRHLARQEPLLKVLLRLGECWIARRRTGGRPVRRGRRR
jgi:hypothetical protein